MMENKVYELVRTKMKSNCRKVLRDEMLYIQPEDDRDIDAIVRSNLDSNPLFQENSLDLEFEAKAIEALFPELKKKTVTSRTEGAKQIKEQKSTLENIIEGNVIDDKIISALQSMSLSKRVEPPEEFFITYIDSTISFPIFMAYLLVIVLINSWNALFDNT